MQKRRRERRWKRERKLPLEKELLEREILLWAGELAWEMNLRLLLDGELGLGKEERILFVESVSVTDIHCPVKRKRSLFDRIKLILKRKKGFLWQLLNNLLDYRWTS